MEYIILFISMFLVGGVVLYMMNHMDDKKAHS